MNSDSLVIKLEQKFNDFIVHEILRRLDKLSETKLRTIARNVELKNCTNHIQEFIQMTLACSAKALLMQKFGVKLEEEKTIQE